MVADQTLRERSRVVKLAERVIVEDEGAKRCREGLEGGLLWRRWWNRQRWKCGKNRHRVIQSIIQSIIEFDRPLLLPPHTP